MGLLGHPPPSLPPRLEAEASRWFPFPLLLVQLASQRDHRAKEYQRSRPSRHRLEITLHPVEREECQSRRSIQESATLLTVSVVQVLLTGAFSGRGKATLWLDGISSVLGFVVVFPEDSLRLALDFSPFLAGLGLFLIGLSVPSDSKIPSG